MKSIRRAVLGCCMLAAGCVFAAVPVELTIDATKPGPVINKHVYGQLTEHLGSELGDGMWVGPGSTIPNIKGWRKDVVGALQVLRVPLLRWPGGCFADAYHWRDGLGAPGKRPVTLRSNGGEDSNAVGTHEFFDLAELLGADAYVSGNVGTGTAREAAQWVEYMTAEGASSLARLRAQNGHPKPFKVAFFGIGNESSGCGGNMAVEHYADLYNQYAVFIKSRSGAAPKLVADGGDDVAWVDRLSKKLRIRDYREGIGLHFSAIDRQEMDKEAVPALKAALQNDGLIAKHAAKLGENDPKNKLFLAIDAWGGSDDAVAVALNFHILHAHADRVRVANFGRMQSMILVDGDKIVLTPTYHVFKMYLPFQDATVLPATLVNNPNITVGGGSIPSVSATAARGKDGKLYLGLVNTNPKEGVDVTVGVDGGAAKSASGSVLTAPVMDARHTRAAPGGVVPVAFRASAEKEKLTLTVPAKAIVVVVIAE